MANTYPQLRNRYSTSNPPFGSSTVQKQAPAPPAVSKIGGLLRILQGAFGIGAPTARSSDPNEVQNSRPGPLYAMHEGDIFEPGTGNWVLDPPFDGPLNPVWGNGVSYPYVWMIEQQPVAAVNTVVTNGLGGQVAGQIALQPLIEPAIGA